MIDRQLRRLSVLSHADRLAVFRMLVRRLPDAVSAGDIARGLGLKASTLSAHLSALEDTGLVSHDRQGTSLLYKARLDGAQSLVSFLFEDCCRGRTDLCLAETPGPGTKPMRNENDRILVLFVCTGNSARSIIAETLLRAEAGDRFIAYSAGTRPRPELNPDALELLKSQGHEIGALRAKPLSDFQGPNAPKLDFVLTLCDRAANEECPPWPGPPVSAHWGLPDPAADRMRAFQGTYATMLNRIRKLAALPVDTLDRASLQTAVDLIAETEAAQ